MWLKPVLASEGMAVRTDPSNYSGYRGGSHRAMEPPQEFASIEGNDEDFASYKKECSWKGT